MAMIEIAPDAVSLTSEQRLKLLEEKLQEVSELLSMESQHRLQLQEELTFLRRQTPLHQAQVLMVLGETMKRQAQAMLDHEQGIPTTVVKLVPQEEEPNNETLWAVKDADTVSLFAKKDGQFHPFTHPDINMDVIVNTLSQADVVDGQLVSINVYLIRDYK